MKNEEKYYLWLKTKLEESIEYFHFIEGPDHWYYNKKHAWILHKPINDGNHFITVNSNFRNNFIQTYLITFKLLTPWIKDIVYKDTNIKVDSIR